MIITINFVKYDFTRFSNFLAEYHITKTEIFRNACLQHRINQ